MAFTQRSTNEVLIIAVLQSILDGINAIIAAITGGTPVTPNAPTSATVGVSSSLILASNSSRKTLTIVNASVNRVSFGFGSSAALDNGVTLYPGGSLVIDKENIVTTDVYAIASASSSKVSIQESV